MCLYFNRRPFLYTFRRERNNHINQPWIQLGNHAWPSFTDTHLCYRWKRQGLEHLWPWSTCWRERARRERHHRTTKEHIPSQKECNKKQCVDFPSKECEEWLFGSSTACLDSRPSVHEQGSNQNSCFHPLSSSTKRVDMLWDKVTKIAFCSFVCMTQR